MKGNSFVVFLMLCIAVYGCNNQTESQGEDIKVDMNTAVLKISGVYSDTISGEVDNEQIFIEVTLNPDSSFTLSRQTITNVPGEPIPMKGPRQVLNGLYLPRDNWKKIKLSSSSDGGHATCFEILPDALKLLDEFENPIAKEGDFIINRATRAIKNVGQFILSYDQKPFVRYPVQAFLRTSGNNIRIHKSYIDQAKAYEKALLAYYALKYNSGCDNEGCAFDLALGMDENGMKNLLISTMPDFENAIVSPVERQRLSMLLINQNSKGFQVHVGYLDAKDQNFTSVDEFALEGEKLKLVKSSGDVKAARK